MIRWYLASYIILATLQTESLANPESQSSELNVKLQENVQQLQAKVTKLEKEIDRGLLQMRLLFRSSNIDLGKSLISAVESGDTSLVLFLLENGANIEYADSKANRPIHLAVARNKHRILEVLLENRADIEAKGEYQKTALHLTANYNRLECAKLLIDKGANLESLDTWGNTPIVHAAAAGFNDIINLLVQKGANVNSLHHYEKMTGLHWAAQYGLLSTAKLLVSSGANTSLRNKFGYTAYDLAVQNDRGAVVNYLKEH